MTLKRLEIFLFALTGILFIENALSISQILVTPDGEGYLSVASELSSGEFWGKQTSEELASSIRTPLYPFFIFLAFKLFGQLPEALLIFHWLLALAVTFQVCFIFRKRISPAVSFLGMTIGTLISSYLAFAVLTEWTGFLFGVELFLLLYLSLENNSFTYKALLGFHCAMLVLLKPVFLPAAALTAIIMFLKTEAWKEKLPLVVAFLVPLIIWSSFNFYRQGTFSISPYGKFNLFGVAALSGYAEVKSDDSARLKEFIEFTNQNKFPSVGNEDAWMDEIHTNYRKEKYDHNLWKVADKFRKLHNLTRPEINTLCGQYSYRVLKKHFSNYLKYVFTGMSFGWVGYLVSILTIELGAWALRKIPNIRSLALASIGISIFHLVTMTASVSTITWLPRYEWMLATPVEIALFLLSYSVLASWLDKSSVSKSY